MIIEKALAISFWAGVGVLALLGSMYFNVWAETPSYYTNEVGHDCYYALTPNFTFYDICYPSLDDRILGEKSYSSLDIPELTGVIVVINEGNTHRGEQ